MNRGLILSRTQIESFMERVGRRPDFEFCLGNHYWASMVVATDSDEIVDVLKSHGGNVIMTSASHQTGTDRIVEAARTIDADVIVNVQGDEALVNPRYIDKVIEPLAINLDVDMAILVNRFKQKDSPSVIKGRD